MNLGLDPTEATHRAGRQDRAGRWPPRPAPTPTRSRRAADDSIRAMMLIRSYRVRGHLAAKLDPLGLAHSSRSRRAARPRTTASPTPTSTARSGSAARSASSRRPCARSSPVLEANYCGHGRPRIYAHQRPRGAPLPPGPDGGQERRHHLHPRGQAGDPREGHPRRAVGKVPRPQICRHQTVRPRRRRERGPGA